MQVFSMSVGSIGTNCYLVYDETSLEGIVIDPGEYPDQIMKEIDDRGLHILYIVNTHGHWDHIGANAAIKEKTGAQIMIHGDDLPYLTDPKLSLSNCMGGGKHAPEPDIILKEGDVIRFGACSLRVLHTPGHTPGGISLVNDHVAFVGDTLFMRSIGRADFPGGDSHALMEAIRTKLVPLPDETVVCPGHGPATTIGAEKQNNPYLQSM